MYLYKLSDKILEWGLLSWCMFWTAYAFMAQSWFSLVLNGVLVLYWGNLALRHFVYERASSVSTKVVYQRVMEQLPRFVDKAMPTRAVMAPDGMSFLLVLWNKPVFPWSSPRYSVVLSLIERDVLAEADKRFSATSTYYALPPVRGRVYAQALDGSGDDAIARPRILDILTDRPTERVEATQQEFETIETALKTWHRRIAIA